MPYNRLSTSKIAQAAGCHPNTVRMYEQQGFLPPVQRAANGYRLYTPAHLHQMIFARAAFNSPWCGRALRRSLTALVLTAASRSLEDARVAAARHLELVRAELAYAEDAASALESWASLPAPAENRFALRIREAAHRVGATPDMLRGWERDGMLDVPRNPRNRYREYGAVELARLRVIRLLRSAGYSTMAILRMLLQLDNGGGDLRAALDTPRPDEDAYVAADRWLTSLHEAEENALLLVRLLDERE